jgi:TatD DNase family protein
VIDFHCHLDLFSDPAGVAARAEAAGIYVLSVTTTPKAFRQTSALAKGSRHIRTALGLHPELAHERSNELALFEALLYETRYVGEVGLDGSPKHRPHADIQRKVFGRILAIARSQGGKILTVHSRRAASPVIDALRAHRCGDTAVLHWFSGTQRQLSDAVALGCWFSVGPSMLRSEKGRHLVALMPRERVLTETDGPFGQLGDRPLEPIDVVVAVEQLAGIWSIEKREADQRLRANLRELLARVPDPADPHA